MKYYIDTYGCQMNIVESNSLQGILESAGWQKCDSKEASDLLIFNTCCVRESAEERVYGNIGAAKNYKKQNPNMIIAVCGCMAEREGTVQKIKESYKHVDIVFGTMVPHKLLELIDKHKQTQSKVFETGGTRDADIAMPVVYDNTVTASISIMYGCNNFCSYCIVPYVRGREISKSYDNVINECNDVIDKGYRDILLIGQNVNSYKSGDKNFSQLLKDIDSLDGDFIIKFMSSHPKDFGEDVIDTIANSKHIEHHIHLPLQSGNDRILNVMNRKYTASDYLDTINKIKSKISDVQITTDIIVGFPTETNDEFEDTIKLIKEIKFANVYSFIYSKRSGTLASTMLGQVDYKTKKERIKKVIDTQADIGAEIAKEAIGKEFKALCYNVDKNKKLLRTRCGRQIIIIDDKIKLGDFVTVNIIGSKKSNLIGKIKTYN